MLSVKKMFVCDYKIVNQIIIYLVFCCVLFLSYSISAQGNPKKDTACFCDYCQPKFEIGVGYFDPVPYTNEIKTITLDGFYWKRYFKNADVLIGAGVTANYAWGYSIQWYPLGDTAFLLVNYKTSAFGIGPVFQIAPTIVKIKRFSLITEANGGILLYNKRFPYGGDFYNFIFRAGPSIAYRINDNYLIKFGGRFIHVSNGKGNGNQNPYYDGIGLSLGVLIVK